MYGMSIYQADVYKRQTKDRSSFRVSGLAVSAVYSPLAFVSSMCTYSAQASQSRAAALSLSLIHI